MKELSELGLKSKDLKKVTDWLESWVAHFNGVADNAKATVERYDLEKLDFFYFTECIDILSKNPESKGVEDNKVIIKRKRAVEYSLIFRRLLGETLGRKRPCSHCGNDDRFINSLGDGTGHYVFCPKCGMTTIVTYPDGYDTCTKRVLEDLTAHGMATKIPKEEFNKLQEAMSNQKECPTCRKFVPIKDYALEYDQCKACLENRVTSRRKTLCDTCKKLFPLKDFTFSISQCNTCYYAEAEERDTGKDLRHQKVQ